jgi:hypothetical protein
MADSTTVQLSSSGDTLLDSFFPTTNNGTLTFWSANLNTLVSLIKFDVSSIPADATVTSSKIIVTCRTGTASDTVQLHRVLLPWTEGGATWNTYDGTNSWGTAGAGSTESDYNDTLLGTLTWTAVDDQIEAGLDITVIQSWINGLYSNYGFRISPVTGNTLTFHSEESATPAFRPLLEVSYTTPLDYEVNSTAISGGIQASWQPIQVGQNGDGSPQYSPWYRHVWSIPVLEMADYLTLEALRGTELTELKTTDKDTPNSTGTYTTGRVMTVTGQHRARQMLNVRIEFLVDAS